MKTYVALCALTIAALLVVASVGVAAASPAEGVALSVPSPSGYLYHTVQPGENLYRISLRYGVSMYAIMQANGLRNANYVYVGQVLRIPTGPVTPPPQPPRPQPSPAGFYYTVKSGDTLAIVAARYATTVWAIMQANGLANPNFIYVGQVLWIPGRYTPPPPSNWNWYGEYFNNEWLSGAPSVTRYDSAINFDWGLGWPHPRISADKFSVRWTRNMWLGTGTYRFTVTVDDGVRLWVDDVLTIDEWREQPVSTFSQDVPLGAGSHRVRIEYFDMTGLALARFKLDKISDTGPWPCGACVPGDEAPTGAWLGKYYDNQFLQGDPTFTRTDGKIEFDWGKGGPGGGIEANLWSARWTQRASFNSGTYRFHIIVDDGTRLFVDGRVLIDEWHDSPGNEYIADKKMAAGGHDLQVDYYQFGHDAKIKVWWEKLP